MTRHLFNLLVVLLVTVSLIGCAETPENDEYSNWEQRNEDYIDSVAAATAPFINAGVNYETALEGEMFRILSFKLEDTLEWSTGDYVYCKVIRKGAGVESPNYSDSVKINFRVRLIPTESYTQGVVVDQSYKTPYLDPSINVPRAYALPKLVNGMISAVQYMKEGDIWRMYIPYKLGYGSTSQTYIPAYSTLIFDVNLISFRASGIPLP